MNIALVIFRAVAARGGAERYTIDLARALAQRGHTVSLLASTFDCGGDAGVLDGGDVKVARVLVRASGATRGRKYTCFIRALNDHLDATRYDVVHAMLPVPRCDVYHPHAGVAADFLAAAQQKHDAAWLRSARTFANRLNRKRQKFAAVERAMMAAAEDAAVAAPEHSANGAARKPPRRPPLVLCLSEYVRAAVLRHYPDSLWRLRALFNGVDLNRFDPALRPDAGRALRHALGIGDDRIVALFMGQDFARKGLREAVLALEGASDDPPITLLVAGKESTAPYEALARSRGVRDRIVFAGPTSDPHAFYRAADALILPTRHDPCSLVVLEALAMGVPVISTAANGATEIMTDGVHGWILSDAADVASLRQKLRSLGDADLRARLSAACLALRPRLSQDAHMEKLLEIYNEAAAEKVSSRYDERRSAPGARA